MSVLFQMSPANGPWNSHKTFGGGWKPYLEMFHSTLTMRPRAPMQQHFLKLFWRLVWGGRESLKLWQIVLWICDWWRNKETELKHRTARSLWDEAVGEKERNIRFENWLAEQDYGAWIGVAMQRTMWTSDLPKSELFCTWKWARASEKTSPLPLLGDPQGQGRSPVPTTTPSSTGPPCSCSCWNESRDDVCLNPETRSSCRS